MEQEQKNYVKYFFYFLIVALFFISVFHGANRSNGVIIILGLSVLFTDLKKLGKRCLFFLIGIVLTGAFFITLDILSAEGVFHLNNAPYWILVFLALCTLLYLERSLSTW